MQIPQPGTVLGQYRIERLIGQGGMGVVYAATDTRLGREVALKVITGPLASNEEFRRRFHHEALAMSRVQSPWVVQVHDHDELDGYPYIVTQFVAGTDLGSLVEQQQRLTARRALRLCAQVARGLDDVHRAGVLHRDVKPGNVLLSDPGTPHERAFLCDFGIATSDAASHHTATGMVAGTWAYLAPERTLGSPAVPASDLYAVGCMLWTCLTGSTPYTGTEVEMAIAHASAPIPQLPDDGETVRGLNALLTRVMAKDPKQRHADGAALAAEMEALAATASDEPVRAPVAAAPPTAVRSSSPGSHGSPPPPPPAAPAAPTEAARPAGPSPRRRRWPLVVGGIVALALVGGLATWAGLAARDDDEPGGAKGDPKPVELVSGDLTGDGLGDVVAQVRANAFEAEASGTGTVTSLASTGTTLGEPKDHGTEAGRPLLGDVDGDGRMDQVWFTAQDGAGTYKLRVIPGDGSIWEHPQTLTATVEWDVLTPYLADVDGDGSDDLLFANSYLDDGSLVTMYASLAGDESFAKPELVLDLGRTEDPITGVGDLDGDGDDDLFRATNTHRGNRITGVELQPFVNDDGSFSAEEPLRPDVDTWGVGWFMAGDVDDDGADEVVVTNGRRGSVGVVELDADEGRFGDVTEWLPGRGTDEEWEQEVFDRGAPAFEQSLSDVDGDGDDDLVSTRERDGALQIGVAVSDGESFAPFGEDVWGTITSCPLEGCGLIRLVVNVEPSIL